MDLPFTPEEKQQFLRRNYVVPLERHVDLFRNATQGVPDVSPQEHNQFLQRVENILQFEGRTDVQNIIIKNATKDFSGIPEGTIWNVYVPALREEYARGQGGRHEIADKEKYMFDRYIEEAHRQHPEIKIEPFQRPPHKAMQEFIQKHYPNGAPAAEGLYMEEYGVAASDRGKASKDMLATDYLVDCEAVVLTARKKDDPEKRMAVLAHMDVTTDVPKAVHKILGEIPPGYDVYATILASGLWSNPYIETETVNALVSSGRISSLRYNVDDPTTVAVHTQTGEILAARLHKDKSQAYKITGELPFPVHFDKTREQQERLSYDTINWVSIEDGKSERLMSGGSSLRRVVHPTKTPEPVAGPRRDIQRRMEQTGTATKADLMALAKDVGDHLKLSNVCYDVVGQDVAFQLGEYPLNYIALPVGVTIDKKVKSGNCK